MKRREFLRTGAAALASACLADRLRADKRAAAVNGRFRLKYAPHFGLFKHLAGHDLLDQLKFAADHGFVAWQDNGLKSRPVEVQDKIGRTMASLGMEMGLFVASTAFPAMQGGRNNNDVWKQVLNDVRDSVPVAKRVQAKCITLWPDRARDAGAVNLRSERAVELLKRCGDILEPHGLVMVLEPSTTSDPGTLVAGIPSCKLLVDICRWQRSEGHSLSRLEASWPAIGYLQSADNPGRREPGTGTIDYRRVFRYLAARGYAGIVGMEHGNSKSGAAGERAVIEAYAAAERA